MAPLSEVEVSAQNPYRPSKRGGRRPGAGAPRGNLNALKPCPEPCRRDGANSQQLQQLAIALALVPDARKALARLVRRQRRQQACPERSRRARARTVAIKLQPEPA